MLRKKTGYKVTGWNTWFISALYEGFADCRKDLVEKLGF